MPGLEPTPGLASTLVPAIVNVVLQRETEWGEFSCGVIHGLQTKCVVSRPHTIKYHLPPAPASAQPTLSSPATTPPSASRTQAQKADIRSIKGKVRTLLYRTMLQMEGISWTWGQQNRYIDSALQDMIINTIGDVGYELFKPLKLQEETVTSMSQTQRFFKMYVSHNVQSALDLRLPVMEKAKAVKQLLLPRLKFLHKIEMEASILMFDLEKLNCIFVIMGAAVNNILKVYHEGMYKNVHAFTDNFYNPYSTVMTLIDDIWSDDALREWFELLCNLIITLRQSDMGMD
ncbi:hypothetical protein DEU56DRAFT_755177 [Suillus clintonianus]|uniref:uncharacterized protein n=1 Tax=Suillus clintonianus TaxID=1904413 RepID=UPI001B86DD83|nr:uncharacterized protein DEU56DRAFT_755177 [Suillus clintonianus]KAG2140559.1 hypothetical protein DEU56DRAFT_755177 [Suillus clintonianus]